MKERPILFSAPMVKAILDGRKTQTRRVFKHPENYACLTGDCPHTKQTECDAQLASYCKYGQPGDRLWVKETHQIIDYMQTTRVVYRADGGYDDESWRPSIFMRKMDSRITLEVTGVCVERLQDISEEDALAEGIDVPKNLTEAFERGEYLGHRNRYMQLWDSINGKTHPWASNPWVWLIEFRRIKP